LLQLAIYLQVKLHLLCEFKIVLGAGLTFKMLELANVHKAL